ncbi:MAG: hypothetical protein V4489_03170 [Chlamydiota bacterium]
MYFFKIQSFFILGIIISNQSSVELDIQLENKRVIYSELDYLLWAATQDGLSYATISSATIPATNGAFVFRF